MPKKKQKKFRVDKMVREMARERIGEPPASRVVPDGKKKRESGEKHKPTLEELTREPSNGSQFLTRLYFSALTSDTSEMSDLPRLS